MSFIKKYMMLLVPAAIVLAAGVVIVLTVLTSRSLAKEIAQQSLRANDQIASLLRKPLSERQVEIEKLVQDQHAQDAKGVVGLAMQCTLRELIRYDVFPRPQGDSQQLFDEFGQDYRSAIEQLVRGMRALEAPTDIEIQEALNEGPQTQAARGAMAVPVMGAATMEGRGFR